MPRPATRGEVITTPNGQIVQVTNFSRDWARAVVDVPVPAAVDVSQVSDMLRQKGISVAAGLDTGPATGGAA